MATNVNFVDNQVKNKQSSALFGLGFNRSLPIMIA